MTKVVISTIVEDGQVIKIDVSGTVDGEAVSIVANLIDAIHEEDMANRRRVNYAYEMITQELE